MGREGWRERARVSNSLKQTALNAEPSVGLDLMTLRSRPEPKPGGGHLANRVTQALQDSYILKCVSFEGNREAISSSN